MRAATLLLAGLALVACGSDPAGTGAIDVVPEQGLDCPPSSGAPVVSLPEPPKFGPPRPPTAGPGYLFDDLAPVRRFDLTVAEDDWAWLRDHPLEESWVPATLDHAGQRFEGASVRFKGSYGSLVSCVDADTGEVTCRKLSLKVSFNEADPDGRFHGVRKLVFNACQRDDTCLRERLSYALFRRAGLPASRAVHALVSVNGGPASLYLLVEHIDREWLEERYDDPDGNLYKEAWPRATDPAVYQAKLVTNEAEGDVSRLVAFAKALAAAPEGALGEHLSLWIDPFAMARYFVVDQMTNNWDGIWKFYCQGPYCGNHNFYLYDDPSSRRFVVIPWDLDHTFNVPNEDMARSWLDDSPAACQIKPINLGVGVGVQAPQCDKLLRGLMQTQWEQYRAQVHQLVVAPGAPLGRDAQLALLDRYRATILPHVEADPRSPPPLVWRKAVAQLREIVVEQTRQAEAFLEDPIAPPAPVAP